MISFINDDNLSIQYDGDFALTKQVASFKNFKIKGDVSVSFSVPNTSDNRKALGYYGLNQIDSPIFSNNKFNLVKNGNILMRGDLIIEESTAKDISLYFISGNADWFKSFQFSCKEVRNSSLNVYIDKYYETWGCNELGAIVSEPKDYGIVWPLVDPVFKGQAHTIFSMMREKLNPGNQGGVVSLIRNGAFSSFIPCLFMHTLIKEIAKYSGIKIQGSILQERTFKSLIITPESGELYDPDTNELVEYLTTKPVKIEHIAPNFKAIELIKWICISFGCIPVFDVYSKTLELIKLDSIDKGNSYDWSAYIQDYTIENDIYQNNYIRVQDVEDEQINEINESSIDLKYGDLKIEIGSNGLDNEIYESPFGPAYDSVHTAGDEGFFCYVPLWNLEDEESYFYSSVTNDLGFAYFVSDAPLPFDPTNTRVVFRIKDDSGIYDGYHYYAGATGFNYIATTASRYISDSGGEIFTQNVSVNKTKHRVLVYVPKIDANQFSNRTGFAFETDSNFTRVATAYYFKPYTDYAFLNGRKQGLSYGPIDGKVDRTLKDTYLRTTAKMVTNPTLVVDMLLPESVFLNYNFDRFIYLKHKDLNGYFFVEKIENYKDGVTPVRVYLLYVD